MKKILIFFLLLSLNLFSQNNWQKSVKIEYGVSFFQYHYLKVDVGPDWKGYYLNSGGYHFGSSFAMFFKNQIGLGIHSSFLNFKGIKGFAISSDFDIIPFETKLRPLMNIKIGINHLWNQYEGGTTSEWIEQALGAIYSVNDKFNIYLHGGYTFAQQSLLITSRIGILYNF